jgi:putative spermidine/putrescine transport system permease protein
VSVSASPPLSPAVAKAARGPRRRLRNSGLFLPAVILLVAFFLAPLAVMVVRALTDPELGFQNFSWFFGDSVQVDVLVRTFTTALIVTVVCALLAYPYAYLMTVVGPKGLAILTLLVLVPFWTSLMVRTFAWVILLQDSGFVNQVLDVFGLGPVHLIRTTTGVVIGMSQILLPFMVMPLFAVMRGIDRRLLQASGSLGAKPLTTFFRIWLPLSLPGLAAGSLMVFISSLGFYVTPALLGSPDNALVSQQIFTQVNGLLEWGHGGAMGVIVLVMTLVLLAISAGALRLAGRGRKEETA